MTKAEQIVCNFVGDFINNHFDEVNKTELFVNRLPTTRKEFVDIVRHSPQMAVTILTEMMRWDMDKDYYSSLKVNDDNNGFTMVLLNNDYIRLDFDTKLHRYNIEIVN